MPLHSEWAKKEQTESKRILALLPTGVLFLYLLPLAIVWGGASLDRQFGLPPIDFGTIKLILGSLLMVVGFFFGIWSV